MEPQSSTSDFNLFLILIVWFHNMATILVNENSTRLLICVSSLLLLIIANSHAVNGTELLSTSSSYPDNGTEQLSTSSPNPDNGTEQLSTSSPNLDNGTEQLSTSSSYPDGGTEQLPTSNPYPDNETEQQQSTIRPYPNNRTLFYLNQPTIETICTNSSLQVHMKFSRPYDGVAFSNEYSHNISCSILTHPSSKDTEVVLELLFNTCGNRMRAVNTGVLVYNTIVIQQHRMIPSRLDSVQNVSCVRDNVTMDTLRPAVIPTTRQRKPVLQLEISTGSDLYPDEEFQPANFSESELYIVIKVADMRVNKDMVVRNCIAHDQRIISNQTNLYQLSNFYGCPDNSSLFGDFIVSNEPGEFHDMMAYAMIKNFTMFADKQLYITCGVNLCINVCQPKCDEDESERYRQFSRSVVKKIVQRLPGATTPSTLRLFTENPERVRRSVSDVFSSIFQASKSLLDNIRKENSRQLSMMEASSKEVNFPSDFSYKENETMATHTNMEAIASKFVDEGAPSTNFEVINLSTETNLQEKASFLKNRPAGNRNFSGDVLPMASEIFVCVLFGLLFGMVVCFSCKKGQK